MVPIKFRVMPSLGKDRDEQFEAMKWLLRQTIALRRRAAARGIDLRVTVEIVRDSDRPD